jgi:manganese transport protein
VSRFLQISLGILAAVGGFVDIGDLVFNAQAGAIFGYQLIWAVLVGMVGIMVYSEMCGRVAAAASRPVFDTVRERLGARVGFTTLLAAQAVNILTVTAEVGGIAIVLKLLLGLPYRPLVVLAAAVLLLLVWLLPFEWIERVFGLGGLLLVTFSAAALSFGVDWGKVASGLVPHVASGQSLIWAYFVVGVIGSTMMPYEIFFYSSGGVEEGWIPPGDIKMNRLTVGVGYSFGGLLAISIMIVAAQVLLPRSIEPEFLATTALGAQQAFGTIGLLLGLLGMLFAVMGASIETGLAAAYNMAQYFGWEWGVYRRPGGASRFTLAWIGVFLFALLVLMTGVDPVLLTEYSVIFSVVAMPLVYLPVLSVSRDRAYMGEYANGRLATTLGWVYLGIIGIVALSAIPLMVVTHLGQG